MDGQRMDEEQAGTERFDQETQAEAPRGKSRRGLFARARAALRRAKRKTAAGFAWPRAGEQNPEKWRPSDLPPRRAGIQLRQATWIAGCAAGLAVGWRLAHVLGASVALAAPSAPAAGSFAAVFAVAAHAAFAAFCMIAGGAAIGAIPESWVFGAKNAGGDGRLRLWARMTSRIWLIEAKTIIAFGWVSCVRVVFDWPVGLLGLMGFRGPLLRAAASAGHKLYFACAARGEECEGPKKTSGGEWRRRMRNLRWRIAEIDKLGRFNAAGKRAEIKKLWHEAFPDASLGGFLLAHVPFAEGLVDSMSQCLWLEHLGVPAGSQSARALSFFQAIRELETDIAVNIAKDGPLHPFWGFRVRHWGANGKLAGDDVWRTLRSRCQDHGGALERWMKEAATPAREAFKDVLRLREACDGAPKRVANAEAGAQVRDHEAPAPDQPATREAPAMGADPLRARRL
jgi:hypothetical protein